MIRRYQVTLWKPERYELGHRAVFVKGFRTIAAAVYAAEKMLRKHRRHETRYRSTWKRAFECTVRDAKTDRHVCDVEAELDVVPSVGELGWTP